MIYLFLLPFPPRHRSPIPPPPPSLGISKYSYPLLLLSCICTLLELEEWAPFSIIPLTPLREILPLGYFISSKPVFQERKEEFAHVSKVKLQATGGPNFSYFKICFFGIKFVWVFL